MKWIETKIELETSTSVTTLELIADLFYDMGVKGVVLQDGADEPGADWAADAEPSSKHKSVTGYFLKDSRLTSKQNELKNLLNILKYRIGFQYQIVYQEIDEEEWSESWKQFFFPIRIGKHVVVKPTWREFNPNPGDIILELDPGMAFGTGSHPTTHLCLELIEKYLQQKDVCLDVGAGSGILMIAAAKLGAARVVGVDKDPMTVEVAEKNLRLNNIHPTRYCLSAGSYVQGIQETFHLISANILTEVIVSLLEDVPRVLATNGIFICSGIIQKNSHRVENKLFGLGFKILENRQKEEWVSIAARLNR